MKEKLAKLIDVKTIVTFALTGVFGYLSVIGKIDPQNYMTIYTMIIGFYFGTQHEKNQKEDKNDKRY